jgi:hypothetical protein
MSPHLFSLGADPTFRQTVHQTVGHRVFLHVIGARTRALAILLFIFLLSHKLFELLFSFLNFFLLLLKALQSGFSNQIRATTIN